MNVSFEHSVLWWSIRETGLGRRTSLIIQSNHSCFPTHVWFTRAFFLQLSPFPFPLKVEGRFTAYNWRDLTNINFSYFSKPANGVFPKCNGNSVNSVNLKTHWSVYQSQFSLDDWVVKMFTGHMVHWSCDRILIWGKLTWQWPSPTACFLVNSHGGRLRNPFTGWCFCLLWHLLKQCRRTTWLHLC